MLTAVLIATGGAGNGDRVGAMGWYIVFKERNETFAQTAEDRDQAVLEACELHVRRWQVVSIGPFGRGALRDREIEGTFLRQPKVLCLPTGVNVSQLMRISLEFLTENPAELHRSPGS
jgi:hypothetical protein